MNTLDAAPVALEPARHASGAERRGWWSARWDAWVTACFLAVVCLTSPGAPLRLDDVDSAWCGVLAYAHARGLQFGADIAWTYGPLGFLTIPFYSDHLAGLRLLIDVLLGLCIAGGICQLAWRLAVLPRWLLIFSFAILAANNDSGADLLLDTGLMCWGLLCFLESGRRLLLPVIAFTALGVFGVLNKVTYLTVAGAGVVLIGAALWARGRPAVALGTVSGFGAGLLLGWVGLGQSLENAGLFLKNAWAVSDGYDAMALTAPQRIWWVSVAVLALGGGMLSLRCGWAFGKETRRAPMLRLLMFAWLGSMLFVAWKHFCVRCDVYHAIFLFGLLPLMAVALEAIPAPVKRAREWAQIFAAFVFVTCALGLEWRRFPGYLSFCASHTLPVAVENFQKLAHPADYHRQMAGKLNQERVKAGLPRLRATIGTASMDVFGEEQAYALFNGFNYQPRPVFQSYNAYTPALAELNERFYASDKAPEFVLFKLKGLDGRYSPLDDSLLLRHLLVNYVPVGCEGPFVLLKRNTWQEPALTLLKEGTVRGDDLIELGAFGDANLWLQIELRPSLAGKARRFLYRNPRVQLEVQCESGIQIFLAPPALMQTGFVASPRLVDSEDTMRLWTGGAVRRPGAYRIKLSEGTEWCWQPDIRFRLFRIENLVGGALAPATAGFPKAGGPT